MPKLNSEKREKILKDAVIENQIYIDSHFHYLSMREKGISIEELNSTLSSPFFMGMDIGTVCDDLPKRYEKLKNLTNIHLSAGIGPWATESEISINEQLQILKKNIDTYPVSAIGEIGLDNYWNYGTKEKQLSLFEKQIDIAEERSLPIIIHTRDSDEEMIAQIKKRDFKNGGILHCFSSSKELSQVALDKGLLISFAGPITYKKNEELRKVLEIIPLESLLLETDSPYLPPEPFRGKFNTPSKMPLIYQRASEIKKVSQQEIGRIIQQNFSNLLGNPKRLD